MLMDKERRTSKRRTTDLDIHFAIADRSDDYTACIENVSGGGMLINSDTALRAGDVIYIRSAEGIPTNALLAWGKACTVKVVYCRKGANRDKTGFGIGVSYHWFHGIHDGPRIPGPDGAVPAPVGSVTIDKHGKVIETNLTFAKMLDYTCSEIIGQPLAHFAVAKDRDILHLHRMQVMEADAPYVCELKLQSRHGKIIDTDFVSNVYLVDDIKVIRCYIRDITRRKRAYEALEKSEKKVRSLVESSMDWTWEVNEKGEYKKKYRWQTKVLDAINRVFREALTCENEKDVADTCLSVAEHLTGSKFGLIGEKNPEGRFNTLSISNPGWDACQMPDSKASRLIENMEIRGIDRSIIREGKSRIVNDPATHPDRVGTPEGHPPISSYLGVPLKLAGETIGLIGLGNKASGYDLADQKAIEDLSVAFVEALMRKRAEKGLQASEERFRTVAEFTYDWEDWIGPDGKYLYVSPSVERITGYEPDAFIKDPRFLGTLIHPDDQKKVERHLLDHAKTHEVKGLDFRIINRNGDTRWISHLCQVVYSSAGKWLGRRTSNRDITEQKTVEKQLRQAQRMESVGRLAGGVAHDFNNMLSVILGYAELALHKVRKAQPLYADLKEIINAARRSADIVQKLLAFAREQIIEPKVLDLNETVESMLKMLRRLIGEDIDLAWLPEAGLWPVMMDPTQVEQILANLCVNARDAIAGVGKVIIETHNAVFDEAYCTDHAGYKPGEYAMIAISDNGCGMDEENLEKIFEPFFTTKAVGRGTGLGLATVYGIVKQNNGFINVYSERGKGTIFKIYFARQADRGVDTRKESERKLPLSHGETVLVVEDDGSLLKLASGILDRLGYIVLTAGTPGEAMRLVEEHTGEIHLLMTDVIMPEMNGKDLAEKIREIRPAMKSLFMSGYTANVIARRGMLDENVQFIQKPFSLKDIATKVRIALEKNE